MRVIIQTHQARGVKWIQVALILMMEEDISQAKSIMTLILYWQIFFIDLRFDDLNIFTKELVEFSTRKGFEFKYMKNDSVRVRAKCSTIGCTCLMLCSWCSSKKRYVVKHYVPNHSCLLGTSTNKRVAAHIIASKFGDVISSMPIIRPSHLKAMAWRELGIFITDKVCRNSKALVV